MTSIIKMHGTMNIKNYPTLWYTGSINST